VEKKVQQRKLATLKFFEIGKGYLMEVKRYFQKESLFSSILRFLAKA
jgi:hypothetical protein